MPIIRDFYNMTVWQKSHALTLQIYKITQDFPKDEQYGLTSQMRRAVMSIPTNIAEGSGRGTNGDFVRFMQISMGSAAELKYQLFLARDLQYISIEQYQSLKAMVVEIKMMLASFMKRIQSS